MDLKEAQHRMKQYGDVTDTGEDAAMTASSERENEKEEEKRREETSFRASTLSSNSLPPPIQPSVPMWLQEEMDSTSPKTNKVVARPQWWVQLNPDKTASVQGELSIKQQTRKLLVNWTPHWCTVRDCTLNCYRHMGDANPVLTLQLGKQIVTSAAEHKQPYAFRIIINEKQAISFAADTRKEMDQWMVVMVGHGQEKAKSNDTPPPVASRPTPYYILPDMVAGAPQPVILSEEGGDGGGSYYLDLQDEESRSDGDVYYPPQALLEKVVTTTKPSPPQSLGTNATSEQPKPTRLPLPPPAAVPKVPPVNKQIHPSGPPPAPPAPAPGHQGTLQKRSGPGMWHRRYCVIKGHQLACYAQKGSTEAVQVQPLLNCTVASTHKESKRHAFKVVPPSPYPTLYFQAVHQQDCFDWMAAIKLAIQAASSGQVGGIVSVEGQYGSKTSPTPKGPTDNNQAFQRSDRNRRSLIGRIRSWSQENLSFRNRRSTANLDYSSTNDMSNVDGNQRQSNFARGAVSLGHGPFRRSRRFKRNEEVIPQVSLTNPAISGVLAVADGSQAFVNHWCELKNLTLNIYRTSQEKKPMISALLPGYTVVASNADHSHDRIIQLTHLTAPRPILMKVPASAQMFDAWLENLKTAANQAKPPKRSWSFRLKRSRSVRGSTRTRPVNLPPLPVAPTEMETYQSGYQPGRGMTARPLPQPPQAKTGIDPVPTFASKLTTDLDALTKAAEADKQTDKGSPLLTKTPDPPKTAPPPASSTKPLPPTRTVAEVHTINPVISKPASLSNSRTPSPSTMSKREGTSSSTPSSRVPPVAKKPTVPRRKESINSSDEPTVAPKPNASFQASVEKPSLSNPSRSASASPRPRADNGVASMGIPPPMPGGCDLHMYKQVVKQYQARADAISTESQARQAALTSERAELARQQQLTQQSLDESRARLSNANDKGKIFKGSATGEMADLQREVAKMQNRTGFLDGKLSRLDDQLMQTNTELKTSLDRLEKERASEIQSLGDDGLESCM